MTKTFDSMNGVDPKYFETLKDDILKKFYDEMDRFSGRIAVMMKDIGVEVIKNNAYASGNLAGSVSYEIKKQAWEYVLKVFVNAPYADYVHEGSSPHYPPLKPLIQWVRKKGLIAGNRTGKIFNRENEDRAIAARIAHKISKKGTKGIKFFDLALKQALPKIEAELSKL